VKEVITVNEANIRVEVVYALPEKQLLLSLEVPEGTTLEEAIERSGIVNEFPGLEVDPQRVGIFGNKARLQDTLREGDRVEIYRPLIADPKESRRQRAKSQQE
jgi:putative ubiquitin-RnfH superfamily antitoxin RatB of RatAB toxin-antitoxin module